MLTFDLFYTISCSKWSHDQHCCMFSADRIEKLTLIVSSGLFLSFKKPQVITRIHENHPNSARTWWRSCTCYSTLHFNVFDQACVCEFMSCCVHLQQVISQHLGLFSPEKRNRKWRSNTDQMTCFYMSWEISMDTFWHGWLSSCLTGRKQSKLS